jgi:hypothetical protein
MVIDEKPCSHLKNAAALNLLSNNWKSIATCCMVVVSYFCGALSANEPESKAYENRECGISFRHPEGWLIKDVPSGLYYDKKQLCLMRLQPKDLARHLKEDDNIDLYSIQISSSRRFH